MSIETERKFLVTSEFRHLATKQVDIIQTYLSRDPEKTIRIRIAGETAYMTIKTRSVPGRLGRNEWEFIIPLKDAQEMMKICLPGKIVKTRYIIPSGKHKFEVDVFHDRNEGLIIAEIELEYEDESFDRPGWLGDEVTGNPDYYNSNLAK
jgi:adenylate cyclase